MKRMSVMLFTFVLVLVLCACKSAGPITDPADDPTGATPPPTSDPADETLSPTSDPTISATVEETGSAWFAYHSDISKAILLTLNSDGTWSSDLLPMILPIELFKAGLDGPVQHYQYHYGTHWKARLCEDFHLIEVNGKLYAYCIAETVHDSGTYTLDGDNIVIYSNADQSSTTYSFSGLGLEWATYIKLGSISSEIDFTRFE